MMTEMDPELYVPRPGSLPWKVLNFLVQNPEEELTRGDVAVKFDCVGAGIDSMLQLAVARECLKKTRNRGGDLAWILGLVKRFRLDPLTETADDTQVQILQTAVEARPAPAPEVHRAIKVVQIGKPAVPEAAPPPPQPLAAHVYATAFVQMPQHLTPELIEAVATDPSTCFENNADRHHAVGWLFSAYGVMVKHQKSLSDK
jgi:hypothetical protein